VTGLLMSLNAVEEQEQGKEEGHYCISQQWCEV